MALPLRSIYRAIVPENLRAAVHGFRRRLSALLAARPIPWRLIAVTSVLRPIRVMRGSAAQGAPSTLSLDELVAAHFAHHSSVDHSNRASLLAALRLLGGRPARFLETGSSAWGTNSSRLFDSYVRRFGGALYTVDIRSAPARMLRRDMAPSTTLLVGDSVRAMRMLASRPVEPFDFVYLDSFDLDPTNPQPAMAHGLEEFVQLAPVIKAGTLILIDDTPCGWDDAPPDWRQRSKAGVRSHLSVGPSLPEGLVPGKGALVLHLLDRSKFEVVHHGYQLLLRRLA